MTTEEFLVTVATAGAIALVVATKVARDRYRHEFIVAESFAGLLYHDGKLVGPLVAGRHVRWGRNYQVAHIDLRKTLLQIPGQEVLSADNVGVKISVVLTIQIVDAAKSVQTADNYATHLYSATQSAMRAIVAGLTMDALLTQRVSIAAQLRDLLAPQAEPMGVQIHAAEVRDVMLPGDLRKAFSETLKARQEGQAALERARGEAAVLRNLANSARLLETHPGLVTLRFLQTLESSDHQRTLVMNDLSALLPAFTARGAKAREEPE